MPLCEKFSIRLPALRDSPDAMIIMVSDGMSILAEYSKEIHDVYYTSVKEINNTHAYHPGGEILDNTIKNALDLATQTHQSLR